MEAWPDACLAPEDELEWCDTVEVPLLGVVAAGEPYEASLLDETLNVPTALWGGKQVFALRVRGQSMIDEGIHNGDYLIVEPRAVAENGQTVVVDIDGAVTVKKFYREADGQIRLQPANAEMLPLRVSGERVRIIGVVAGIVRKLGFDKVRTQPAIHTPAAVGAKAGRRTPVREADCASLELAVNVMDSQLVRWQAALARAKQDKRMRRHVVQMEELCRNLQAVRDWCARTRKATLRRALIAEANRIMARMQRFATVTPVDMPDLVLH